MREEQVPHLTTNTYPNTSKDLNDRSNNTKKFEVGTNQIEKDLQIGLAALSSLSIRENTPNEPKNLKSSAIIPVEANVDISSSTNHNPTSNTTYNFLNETNLENFTNIWAQASFDSDNNSNPPLPGSTNTSELGQALREGDIPAALQCLDYEFHTKDEEEDYLTDNSLLEEVESSDSLLLDPELYATVFEDNRHLEDIVQDSDQVTIKQEDSAAALESALGALSINTANKAPQSGESTLGRDQGTRTLPQSNTSPKRENNTKKTTPESSKLDLLKHCVPYCIPCDASAFSEEEEGNGEIENTNFDFAKEVELFSQDFDAFVNTYQSKEGTLEGDQKKKALAELYASSRKGTSRTSATIDSTPESSNPDLLNDRVPCHNTNFLEQEEPKAQIDTSNFESAREADLSDQDFEEFIDFSQQQIMSAEPTSPPPHVENTCVSEETANQQAPQKIKSEDPYQYPHTSTTTKAEVISEQIIQSFKGKGKKEKLCLGHKETIFGLSFSTCGRFLASASQDSTVRVWDVAHNSLLSTIHGHSTDHECLRVAWSSSIWGKEMQPERVGDESKSNEIILATAGADGLVKLWQSTDECNTWECVSTMDHTPAKTLEDINEGEESEEQEKSVVDEESVPQIYALGFIDYWKGLPNPSSFLAKENDSINRSSLSILMTSSDDCIHLWKASYQQPNGPKLGNESDNLKQYLKMEKLLNFKFTHLDQGFGGVFVTLGEGNNSNPLLPLPKPTHNDRHSSKAFGGERNPENLVYIFDASHCPSNSLLGVALSDGTVRLVNGRGVCVSILQLPGCQSHLTSFSWSKDGTRLASCVATGHLILWDIHFGDGKGAIRPSCRAVLEGGHDLGRPLYGASFCGGEEQELLLSWGVDGKLCLWDSGAEGQIGAPISVLTSNKSYPLYAADIMERQTNLTSEHPVKHIAIGGGRDGSFMGVLLYIYDVC